MPRSSASRVQSRFGIGEWYGYIADRLEPDQRLAFASLQATPKVDRISQICPFQSTPEAAVACTKSGGVCSMRLYTRRPDTGCVQPASGADGCLRPVCPYRFREDGLVTRWVGENLLGTTTPMSVNEVDFLRSVGTETVTQGEDVGRIDQVLLASGSHPLEWCAVEIQAVYITGDSISSEFAAVRENRGECMPFPKTNHRPDYRSSGPKRLLPQLQIKVPSIRRWGKKTAVVIGRDFYAAMAPMDEVDDVSNSDIVWFVMDIVQDEVGNRAHLRTGSMHLTTLERAVEGLTAGVPVSRAEFERRVLAKHQTRTG